MRTEWRLNDGGMRVAFGLPRISPANAIRSAGKFGMRINLSGFLGDATNLMDVLCRFLSVENQSYSRNFDFIIIGAPLNAEHTEMLRMKRKLYW